MARALTGALALALSTCVLVAAAHATGDAPPAIAVGELGARAGGRSAVDALGAALHREIASRSDLRLAPSARLARFVVRGSVVQLEQRPVADGIEVRCAVSLVLADARGGAVRALLDGRAGARGIDDPEQLAQAALQAAVRGALRSVPTHL